MTDVLTRADSVSPPSLVALLQCTNLGGMEKVAYSLFDQFHDKGIQLKITSARSWGAGKERVMAVDPESRTFEYRGKYGWRSFPVFFRHVKSLSQQADVLWVIGNCASCLTAAILTRRKVLLSHHYHHFENRISWIKWFLFYTVFAPWVEAITYPTEFTRNEALKIAPWLKSKTHVVRNGFDVHYTTEAMRLSDQKIARKALQMPEDALIIGNGGWLIKRKRFDVFLRTAQLISNQIPNVRFYICGGGEEEKNLRTLARELGISNKIYFQGWVKDMSIYYQAWDIHLFNTDFDTLPCTPLEAASYGCLCVTSCHYGGLSEFLDHGRTGYILDHHDPKELADIVVKLAQNTELAQKIRVQAAHWLDEEFSVRNGIRFYEDYLKSVER